MNTSDVGSVLRKGMTGLFAFSDNSRRGFILGHVGDCLRSAFFVSLLLVCQGAAMFGAQPGISQVSVIGTNILITTTGSPGDLQFLIRNYALPVSNADNAILIQTVGTNGLAQFTTELQADVSFFRAKTVSNPVIIGSGTNEITIIGPPEDLILTNSGTATFMVIAESTTTTDPLQYQWFRNGTMIAGATDSTYTFSAGLADNGSSYSCDVNIVGHPAMRVRTSNFGSPDARLWVVTGTNTPPLSPTLIGDGSHAIRVSAFPKDTIVTNTGTATFSVIAEGTVTNLLQYQWFWNEIPIPVGVNPTAASSTLVITNAHFDPGSTSVVPPGGYSRNSDVGFYSCNVNMVGHRPVRVRSADTNATGALLSVYVGSGTTLYSAYAIRSSSTCLGNYSGYVYFRNNEAGPYYNSLLFPAPVGKTGCTISDASSVAVPAGSTYTRTIYFYSTAMDSCRPPWGPLALGTSGTTFAFSSPGPTFRFAIYILSPSPFPEGAQFALEKQWLP